MISYSLSIPLNDCGLDSDRFLPVERLEVIAHSQDQKITKVELGLVLVINLNTFY